jgi:hypothetical protein
MQRSRGEREQRRKETDKVIFFLDHATDLLAYSSRKRNR